MRMDTLAMSKEASTSLKDVLEAEKRQLGIGEEGAAALCISGGGIRSATFAMGVLQGLARAGLLRKFHYLSTVSGGGYIGSWLSAWIYHSGKDTAAVETALARATGVEPKEILNLRRYSNYLTPRLGALSRDTWVAVAIFVRNLLLNWAVLGPVLFAALLIPRIVVSADVLVTLVDDSFAFPCALVSYALGFVFLVIGLVQPKYGLKVPGRVFVGCFLSVMVSVQTGAICFAEPWRLAQFNSATAADPKSDIFQRLIVFLIGALVIMGVHELIYRYLPRDAAAFLRLPLAVATGLGVQLFVLIELAKLFETFKTPAIHACFTGPLITLSILAGGYIFTGLSSKDLDDLQREWLSSLGSVFLMYAVLWSGISSLVLFAPSIFDFGGLQLPPWVSRVSIPVSAIGTIVSGVLTAWQGFRVDLRDPRNISDSPRPKASLILKVALPLLILFLALILSRAADPLLSRLGAAVDTKSHATIVATTGLRPLLILFGVTVIGGLFLSRFIDVNYFSMHGFYRNRLIRAYLGGAREPNPDHRYPNDERSPDTVTGFDPKDDIEMHELASQRPMHVVNMSLNLVKGKELAWQNRKAESFISTAYFTGAAGEPGSEGAFRPSADFGHAITLGTAMAVSGAAASPNMGYNSSPVTAFLMTLLNVRLGWWLPNPKKRGWFRSGPALGLMWLLMEAFGWTDDERTFVNVSDGGHFENLATYEMIRRRCRYIVISDAGCDPKFGFEDLNNLIRKARVDFQTEILFDEGHLAEIAGKTRRWARAEVIYPETDVRGELLYLKPVLLQHGAEPPDVLEYHHKCASFPHEPTLDQFFTESQFESYRRLGLFTVESLELGDNTDFKMLFDVLAAKSRKAYFEKALSPVDL